MDNPETMATWGTRRRMKSNKTKQYNTRMDNPETIGHNRCSTKPNKTKQNNTTQERKFKKVSSNGHHYTEIPK